MKKLKVLLQLSLVSPTHVCMYPSWTLTHADDNTVDFDGEEDQQQRQFQTLLCGSARLQPMGTGGGQYPLGELSTTKSSDWASLKKGKHASSFPPPPPPAVQK